MIIRLKILLLTILSSLVGISIGNLIILQYEANTFKPWGWNNPPIVVNCYGKDLSKELLKESTDFWITKGEQIQDIEYDVSFKLCKNDNRILDGYVRIFAGSEDNFDSKNVTGITIRKASSTFGMMGANIFVRDGGLSINYLLTHELGHAFGYTHIVADGHIMHPITGRMGGKFWIP